MAKQNRAFSVSNVLSKKFDLLDFQGEFKASLGRPERAFSAIIFGRSGSGKSSFSMQWARQLTNFGTVAYNLLEEGISHTTQMNIERNFMETVANSVVLLNREHPMETLDRMVKPKSPSFYFFDSVQYAQITFAQYKKIKETAQAKKKGLIWVSHAKGKEPKGALADAIRYDVDLKIYVEGYRAFPEGRLNEGGEPFTIWHEAAAKYWKEII